MLLIDGVKYELWTPPSEDDFEREVGKHAEEVFGEDAKYFDLKHRLASRSGTGSIPDGYVITLGNRPEVKIIEFELASHSLQHIVAQIVNITNGVENPTTQQKICNAIEDDINEDEVFSIKMAKAINPKSVHRFLSDCFSYAHPAINIIIDKNSPALEEALRKITPPPRIIEFQTFARQGAGLVVHAHLFEPLHTASRESNVPVLNPMIKDTVGNHKYGDTRIGKNRRKVVVSPTGTTLSRTKFVLRFATEAEKATFADKASGKGGTWAHTLIDKEAKFKAFLAGHPECAGWTLR